VTGPFETEAEARQLAAVQAVYDAFNASPGAGHMALRNERMLLESCAAAGGRLIAFDRRIIAWLAGWEPETCAVVAGLITQAGCGTTRAVAAALLSLAGWIQHRLAGPTEDVRRIGEDTAAALRDLARACQECAVGAASRGEGRRDGR